MVAWSSISRASAVGLNGLLRNQATVKAAQNVIQVRQMGGHGPKTFFITPSRFQWNKFKDLAHFYIMLGLIPVTALVFYANVFIGPAQLAEIPEGYTPKHWEYHRHPITRFIARYIHSSPQQDYEKLCHFVYEENEIAQIRKLEQEVREKMALRGDYQAYYYKPILSKYYRISKKAADEIESLMGDN